MRKILIYWFILFLFGCAKDAPVIEEESGGATTIKTLSYSDFVKKTDLNRMGSLKTMFVSPKSRGKLMGSDLDQIFAESFRINKDSVLQLVTERGTSYVFNMALGTAHARSFQNLTINFYGDKIFAFITTYYPSDAWLLARKTNTHIPFEGSVTYTRLDSEIELSKQGPPSINKLGAINTKNSAVRNKTASAQTVCNYFNIVETIAYGCSYGNHMPWDESCPWNLGAAVPSGQYKAGYHVVSREIQICTVIHVDDEPSPSSGGGGSGGNDTSPYPPDDYNPCEPGQKCTDILDDPHMPAQLFVNQLGITNQNEINFLNDPANYLILGYFQNYFSFDSSWQGREFIRWSVTELASGNITWEQFENWFLGENPFHMEYTLWAINHLANNPESRPENYFNVKHIDYNVGGETNIDFKEGGYDESVIPNIDMSQQKKWETITAVIPSNKFVKYNGDPSACLKLAKSMIEQMGYTISNYYAEDSYGEKQTINLYDGKVNNGEVMRGINYLHHALTKGIPVVVGVDYASGSPNPDTDNTTDHFIVIVGMGNDLDGNYFQYYDPSTSVTTTGTSTQNRLYFNSTTNKIQGEGVMVFRNGQKATYTISMVRKSKKK